MRPRIRMGELVASTGKLKRIQAKYLVVKVKYTPKLTGNHIISQNVVSIRPTL